MSEGLASIFVVLESIGGMQDRLKKADAISTMIFILLQASVHTSDDPVARQINLEEIEFGHWKGSFEL